MTDFALTPSNPTGPLSSDLEIIYNAYPRKVGKRKALLEIDRALRRLIAGEIGPRMTHAAAVEGLVKAASLYARSPAGQRQNRRQAASASRPFDQTEQT